MILRFRVLPERYAIARLAADAAIPLWASKGSFCSITRSEDELSIICEESAVPARCVASRGWRCLAVIGPLAFDEIGIAAEFTTVLAKSEISVLAVSTYDTDYLLVAADHLDRAIAALLAAGHDVRR